MNRAQRILLAAGALALATLVYDAFDSRVSRLERRTYEPIGASATLRGPDPGALEEMQKKSARDFVQVLREEGLVITMEPNTIPEPLPDLS